MNYKSKKNPAEFWKPIINDFNPVGPIDPDDVRNFFVDRKATQPTKSVVQRLAISLQNSIGQRSPYKGLLTGHVGSGKTSELMRLGQYLATDFFVVWFDGENTLSRDKANQFDILLGMGIAVYLAAKSVGMQPNKKLTDAFVKSFASFVRKYEDRKTFTLKLDQLAKQVFTIAITAGAGVLGGPAGAVMAGAAAAGVGAFKATALELNVKDELVRYLELPANRQEIVGNLNKIIFDVQKLAKKPLLVITDGLDKVSALRARLLFAESSLLAEAACALIYAAPIEFYHRVYGSYAAAVFSEYSLLPNPPVNKRPPTGDGWGRKRDFDSSEGNVIREIISQRLEFRGHTTNEVITPEAQNLIASASGGIVRDAIRFMQYAALSAQIEKVLQINPSLVRSVIETQRQEMRARLTATHQDALIAVLRRGSLVGGASEVVEDELLHAAYLLSYQGSDGDFWFDAHPNALFSLSAQSA
jgi:hypothetical protein